MSLKPVEVNVLLIMFKLVPIKEENLSISVNSKFSCDTYHDGYDLHNFSNVLQNAVSEKKGRPFDLLGLFCRKLLYCLTLKFEFLMFTDPSDDRFRFRQLIQAQKHFNLRLFVPFYS